MSIKNLFINIKNKINRLTKLESNIQEKDSSRCENLTSLPGIGVNNCRIFYDAGYKTPESIISADDNDLMNIPGVGISFIKKLRKHVGRV